MPLYIYPDSLFRTPVAATGSQLRGFFCGGGRHMSIELGFILLGAIIGLIWAMWRNKRADSSIRPRQININIDVHLPQNQSAKAPDLEQGVPHESNPKK